MFNLIYARIERHPETPKWSSWPSFTKVNYYGQNSLSCKAESRTKKKLIKEILNSDIQLSGKNFAVLSKVIDYITYADNAASAAELIPAVSAALSEGTLLAATASGLAITSVLLFPVGALINVINALQAGTKMYGMRSAAYTVTAWTFGDGLPSSSPTILRNIRSGPYVTQRSNVPEYHKAWMEARRTTVASLQGAANRSNLSKDILQILFKAIGDNDRQKLCLQFLKGYENHFTALDKKIWISNYKIAYPQ